MNCKAAEDRDFMGRSQQRIGHNQPQVRWATCPTDVVEIAGNLVGREGFVPLLALHEAPRGEEAQALVAVPIREAGPVAVPWSSKTR